jgi:hypothetical protein
MKSGNAGDNRNSAPRRKSRRARFVLPMMGKIFFDKDEV